MVFNQDQTFGGVIRFLNCLVLLLLCNTAALASDKLNIVTSFSILGDITKNIVGDKANVFALVPANSNMHGYNLTPKDLMKLEQADIFLISGLGFEGFMERLTNNAKISAKTLTCSQGIQPLASHEHAAHHHQQHHDPHIWQNPLHVMRYVDNITTFLCTKDSVNCATYQANATAYKDKLQQIDAKYAPMFASIPPQKRIIVTTHDAFNYLAQHYAIEVYAPLGIDNNSEPTAGELVKLQKLLHEKDIHAIFIENLTNNTIIEQVSNANHKVINGVLYSDALCTEQQCSTYLAMIEHNLNSIYQAMSK